MNVPENLMYTPSHEWVRVSGGSAVTPCGRRLYPRARYGRYTIAAKWPDSISRSGAWRSTDEGSKTMRC